MGMKESGWRAHLAKVGWEIMILKLVKYDWGVDGNVVVVVVVRHFPLVHRANCWNLGNGRKGGNGAWKGEIVWIESQVNVLLIARHVWVVSWVKNR